MSRSAPVILLSARSTSALAEKSSRASTWLTASVERSAPEFGFATFATFAADVARLAAAVIMPELAMAETVLMRLSYAARLKRRLADMVSGR
jgi:hypothetical protein